MKICGNFFYYILLVLEIIFLGKGLSNSVIPPEVSFFKCENLNENDLTSEKSFSSNYGKVCSKYMFCIEDEIDLSEKNKRLLKGFAKRNFSETHEYIFDEHKKINDKILKHGFTVRFGDSVPFNSKILKTLGYQSYEINFLVSEMQMNKNIRILIFKSIGNLLALEVGNECKMNIVSVRKILINNKVIYRLEAYAYSDKGLRVKQNSYFYINFTEEN